MENATGTMPENVSGNPTPIYVLFDKTVVEGPENLTRDQIIALAAGTIGAIHIKNFGSAGECASIMRALDQVEMQSYDEEIVYPRIPKLGPAAYDYYDAQGLVEDYWKYGEESARTRETLLDGRDPLDAAIDRLRPAWGGEMAPATADGRAMFAGMIRETTGGMRMHWDEIARELPGALDRPVIAQLGFNWFLSMPDGGGSTHIFRRRWQPADEQFRDGYGYAEELAASQPSVVVQPGTGDAVLFDPRNYHAVRANEGPGRRVAISFFFGVTGSGALQYWS